MSLRVQIDPRLEQKFRELAMKRFGYGKGALSKAAEEAILKWLSTTEKEPMTFEGDPVKAIEGLLKDVNVDSVTLQHETQKLWAKKVLTHVPC
jgi:phage-related protein